MLRNDSERIVGSMWSVGAREGKERARGLGLLDWELVLMVLVVGAWLES